jgi:hypothetical protein
MGYRTGETALETPHTPFRFHHYYFHKHLLTGV